MIRVTQNKDEIIVHEIPFVQWLSSVGVGFMFGGIFFTGIFLLTKIFAFAFGVGALVFAVAALLYHWDNPSTTVKVSNPSKIVSVRKKSLVGYKFDIYNFNEIAGLIYVEEIEALPKEYRIVLPLQKNKKLIISSQVRINEGEYFETADLLNSYIFGASTQISAKTTAWKITKPRD